MATNTIDRLPPQNIELEESILGALMLDKNVIIKVADILEPDDFYKTGHQLIYETILELFNNREPIDILTVSNRLRERKALDEIGGASYLTSLINKVPTTYHTEEYAKLVHKKRILRELISASYDISRLANTEDEEVDNVLDQAEQLIFQISKKKIDQSFSQIKDELSLAFERIDTLQKGGGKLRGVTTGFKCLDNMLSGLQKSDMVVLGARPSMGKTSLGLDIARGAAMRGYGVGVFSLEMSKDQLVDRLIAAESTVNL
jgi:replicative DNA helicase